MNSARSKCHVLAQLQWRWGATLNDNCDDPDHWLLDIAPQAGDQLVFPAGIEGTDRGMDNNFPEDTVFRAIPSIGPDIFMSLPARVRGASGRRFWERPERIR